MASMHDLVARNKRNTRVLIFVFVVLIAALGVAIGMAVGMYTGGVTRWSALTGAVIAATIAFFMILFGFFGGDKAILGMSRAREITHADDPQLFNVVEEMAIAAGIPAPRVYLIDDSAPNAFATGRDPAHAAVAITTGLRDKLTRDELQGVMAHEMSHVRHQDIKFAMLMAILVGTVVLICDVFLRMAFHSGRGRRSGGKGGGIAQLAILVVALLLWVIAPILAKIIQLAVSREREYLADAGAAELTRYPAALASALSKIAADREPLEVANRATQHLYIVNPINKLKGRSGASVWSTHPPVEDRIRRLREMR